VSHDVDVRHIKASDKRIFGPHERSARSAEGHGKRAVPQGERGCGKAQSKIMTWRMSELWSLMMVAGLRGRKTSRRRYYPAYDTTRFKPSELNSVVFKTLFQKSHAGYDAFSEESPVACPLRIYTHTMLKLPRKGNPNTKPSVGIMVCATSSEASARHHEQDGSVRHRTRLF